MIGAAKGFTPHGAGDHLPDIEQLVRTSIPCVGTGVLPREYDPAKRSLIWPGLELDARIKKLA